MASMWPGGPPQKCGRGGGKGECDECGEAGKNVLHITVPTKTGRREFKIICQDCIDNIGPFEMDQEWMDKFAQPVPLPPETFGEIMQAIKDKVTHHLGDAQPDEIVITFDEHEGRLIKEWRIPNKPGSFIEESYIEIDDEEEEE